MQFTRCTFVGLHSMGFYALPEAQQGNASKGGPKSYRPFFGVLIIGLENLRQVSGRPAYFLKAVNLKLAGAQLNVASDREQGLS